MSLLPRFSRRLAIFLLPVVVGLAVPDRSVAQAMPAGLDAGPHGVGFKIISFTDPSRPTGARRTPGERTGDRARRLRVHVWYPAAPASGPAFTLGDYLTVNDLEGAPAGGFASAHRKDIPRMVGLTLTDAEWAAYTAFPMQARRDAAAVPTRFPLLIGMLRPVSVAVAAEHLASHGYVVAFVERQPRETFVADGLVLEGLVMNEHIRDMQMAIARLRTEPNVDPARLGAIGFSSDGLAQLALAMRHPEVDAVVQLESGWIVPSGQSSYSSVAPFDPTALRVPLFFAYSENLGRNILQQVDEIRDMRYAPRYLLYLGESWMTHWDFAAEGIVLATVVQRRHLARAGVARAFLATYRYQRQFLDAFVKADATAEASLTTVPSGRGGALIELTPMPAVRPALTRADFRALLDSDVAKAIARARDDLARDPRAEVFDAAWLNAMGYDASLRNQTPRAVALFGLATEAHPRSANAFDSLSEILEQLGRHAEALAAAEKALAVLPADTTIAQGDRQALADGLRTRIARLRAKR